MPGFGTRVGRGNGHAYVSTNIPFASVMARAAFPAASTGKAFAAIAFCAISLAFAPPAAIVCRMFCVGCMPCMYGDIPNPVTFIRASISFAPTASG